MLSSPSLCSHRWRVLRSRCSGLWRLPAGGHCHRGGRLHSLCLRFVCLEVSWEMNSFCLRMRIRLPTHCATDPPSRAGAAAITGLLRGAQDCLQGEKLPSPTILSCPSCPRGDTWRLLPISHLHRSTRGVHVHDQGGRPGWQDGHQGRGREVD